MSKKKPDNEAGDGKAKGGIIKVLIGGVLLLGAGAGGAYGAVASGLLGGGKGEHGPDVPQLVAKGEADPYAPEGGEEAGPVTVHGDGGSEYRAAYFEFDDSFTTNLLDSPGLVQLNLAASTRHDGRVIQWLEMHELAIRSEILVEMANTPEDEVYSAEGKQRLKDRLTAAINRVLEAEEGFGGVDAVYFRTFLVQ
ncbi:flagellar basal body-associated FliL family protein [Aurantiacibacter poecillastricola]|uniref:flagellar basal body-associated FliL family protein n=1 Tax=Aurantiacibacter poecillastricola TaxID=3064385 RepID=UPI00273D0DB9|nr:flagellar basal body-associated FliL family protein [Aurantiacibacter sp. 219JJ12-13]MDP5263131.1 flagellar basal body-associated FliL family protein [Aurantiacibacter sp. 219JJ12-13]